MASEAVVQRPKHPLLCFTLLASREPQLVVIDMDPVLWSMQALDTTATPALTPGNATLGTPGGPARTIVIDPCPRTSSTSMTRLRRRC